MSAWIEYAGLPTFPPTVDAPFHIDQFQITIKAVFRHTGIEDFRTFIQQFAAYETGNRINGAITRDNRNQLFTTKGERGGIPRFLIRKDHYLIQLNQTKSYGSDNVTTIEFPLFFNLTRYIANHPNGIVPNLSLNSILRQPKGFRGSDVPRNQRAHRWYQSKMAMRACLDGEDNILRGIRYHRCDNVIERGHEYILNTLDLIQQQFTTFIANHQVDGISFEWDYGSIICNKIEVYQDYHCPNALGVLKSLQRQLGSLSQYVDTKHYTTSKDIDAFSIALPLRSESDLKCVFYAKTHNRLRIELRYNENIRTLIDGLPEINNRFGVFLGHVLNHAHAQLGHIYTPLQRILADKQLTPAEPFAKRYTRFFLALHEATGGNDVEMELLLTLLLENASIANVPRNKPYIAKLKKAGVIEEASVRPSNRSKTYLPIAAYRPIIEKLRQADPERRRGVGNVLRQFAR